MKAQMSQVAISSIENERRTLKIQRILRYMDKWQSIQPKDTGSNQAILRYMNTDRAEWLIIRKECDTKEADKYIENFFSRKDYLRDPREAFKELFRPSMLRLLPYSYFDVIINRCFSGSQDGTMLGTTRMYRMTRREMNIFIRKERAMEYKWIHSLSPKTIKRSNICNREKYIKDIFSALRNWRAKEIDCINFTDDSSDVTPLLTYMDTRRAQEAIVDKKTTCGQQKEYIREFFSHKKYLMFPVAGFKDILDIETLKVIPVSYLRVVARRIEALSFNRANVFKTSSVFTQIKNEVGQLMRGHRIMMKRIEEDIRN